MDSVEEGYFIGVSACRFGRLQKSNRRFLWEKGRFFMDFKNYTELVFEIEPLNVQSLRRNRHIFLELWLFSQDSWSRGFFISSSMHQKLF